MADGIRQRAERKEFDTQTRIVAEQSGVQVRLPMSDAQFMKLEKEKDCDLFLPIASARCRSVKAGGVDLMKKLPEGVWIQEMNLLAYTLQQFTPQQLEDFKKKVSSVPRMFPGEMLNVALAICPEAAGFERGSLVCPQYTGENLFDLMEYKRFRDWKKEHAGFQIAKFYFPVEVVWNSDCGFNTKELSPAEAAVYQPQISEMIARQIRPDSCWSDWEGYDCLFELVPYKEHGLLYERPDVEVWNGELWGVIVAGTKWLLTKNDIEVLKEHFNGGIWDGWGECSLMTQVPGGSLRLSLFDCMEVHQQAKGEITFTEKEMFLCQAPYFLSRLQRVTEWEPDFRGEREYGKEHLIWLEVSQNRRRVRIPLPAERSRVSDELKKIGADISSSLRIRIKAKDIFPIHNNRVFENDLLLLNQIAERLQGMKEEDRRKLHNILLDKKWKSENQTEGIWRILESFPEKEKEEHETESMGMSMGQQ